MALIVWNSQLQVFISCSSNLCMPTKMAFITLAGLGLLKYCISSVIRQEFFSIQNDPKNLDLCYKIDLELWDCLGMVKLVL